MPLHIDTLPIVKTADQAPRVRTFLFDVPDGLTWEPGAHVHVAIPGFNEGDQVRRELVRHMSVSTLPEEGYLGFTTRLDSSDSLFKPSTRRKRSARRSSRSDRTAACPGPPRRKTGAPGAKR